MGYLQKEGLRPKAWNPQDYFGPQLRLQDLHQNRGVAKIKDLQGPRPNNSYNVLKEW